MGYLPIFAMKTKLMYKDLMGYAKVVSNKFCGLLN